MNSSGMRSTSEPEGIINVLGDIALFMYLILYMSKYENIYINICQRTWIVPKSVSREL